MLLELCSNFARTLLERCSNFARTSLELRSRFICFVVRSNHECVCVGCRLCNLNSQVQTFMDALQIWNEGVEWDVPMTDGVINE